MNYNITRFFNIELLFFTYMSTIAERAYNAVYMLGNINIYNWTLHNYIQYILSDGIPRDMLSLKFEYNLYKSLPACDLNARIVQSDLYKYGVLMENKGKYQLIIIPKKRPSRNN
jgi:hypothetical protein